MLQGKVYQVLLALLENKGEVVTREEIRARLWTTDVAFTPMRTSLPAYLTASWP